MDYLYRTWYRCWQKYFQLLRNATIAGKILLCLIFTLVVALFAQIKVRLPFTPVPVTGQVYAVLLTGVLLGRLAPASLVLYLAGGLAGIPWFSGAGSGFLFPSLGYLVGFIPASFLVGFSAERLSGCRQLVRQLFLLLAGITIIYLFGVAWLSFFLQCGWKRGLLIGALPFIPFDIAKAYLAALTAARILPLRR
ncbi:MAG TPA: biotin transporter BioY [bacterium]|nr:biotin transporter BioY [bacterium]